MKLPSNLRARLSRDGGWPEAVAQDSLNLAELEVEDSSSLSGCTTDQQTFVDCARSICVRQGGTVFGESDGTLWAPVLFAFVQCDATRPSLVRR